MNDIKDFVKDWGFPGALVIVGVLIFTGAIASPITDTNKRITTLETEIRKLVRLQTVMCTTVAKPLDCAMALTEPPAPIGVIK